MNMFKKFYMKVMRILNEAFSLEMLVGDKETPAEALSRVVDNLKEETKSLEPMTSETFENTTPTIASFIKTKYPDGIQKEPKCKAKSPKCKNKVD